MAYVKISKKWIYIIVIQKNIPIIAPENRKIVNSK